LQDEEAFFRDYAESHKKLSELGFTPPRSAFSCKSGNKQKSLLVQAAAGVAVAAAVVAWAYLCESNKNIG
jgi:L-ascorbate peroxidase